MDIITPIMKIRDVVDKIKKNDQECPHVRERLTALAKLIQVINEKLQKNQQEVSNDATEAVEKLRTTLTTADAQIKKFMEEHKLNQIMKATDYKVVFDTLNKSLTDAFVTLSAALHVRQEETLEEQRRRLAWQERRLEQQQARIADQEDLLLRMEAKFASESRSYYCVIQ